MPPGSVTLPVQFALDCCRDVGAVHAPTALKARFSLMPVCFSHATTYATSAALICISAGAPSGPGAAPWTAAGHV